MLRFPVSHVGLAMLALGVMSSAARAAVHADRLRVPAGFHISLVSDQVPGAREMTRGARGTLFVG
ncbi:MAG: sorbosone dehydrogenase family protein, partial [Komagataeibacter saccharivorans]